jgi:hypothetical protein
MAILRCDFAGGGAVDIPVHDAMIPRVQNAIRLPDIKIADWDQLTKQQKHKMVQDYEWFMKLLTQAKLADRELVKGAFRTTLGTVTENRR